MKNVCCLACFASLAVAHSIASAAPRDVSDVVAGVLAKHKVPGLVGAIVELDGASAIGAAGVRKAGAPDLLKPEDAIHLGSDTKAMTAVLVAQLIEAGDLKYETTMAEAFPAIAPRMDAAMAKVTVEQLLAHRAGLPANVLWGAYAAGPAPVAAKRLKIVEAALSAAPASAPGTAYAYSNVGYMILGAIVESKAKQSWEEAIAKRLFRPLGMATAGFGPTDAAWGHVARGGAYQPIQLDNPEPLGPAGRVHCSIGDWAKFVACVLSAQRADTPTLSNAAEKRLTTPAFGGDYAGGWLVTRRPWAGGTVLTHAGSNTTWYCVAWLAPAKGFALLAATNAPDDDESKKACDDLIGGLMQARGK